MDAAIAEILKQGIVGAFGILFLLGLISRDKSYREVQEKRIDESKVTIERLLVALNANTDATKANAEAIKLLAKV